MPTGIVGPIGYNHYGTGSYNGGGTGSYRAHLDFEKQKKENDRRRKLAEEELSKRTKFNFLVEETSD